MNLIEIIMDRGFNGDIQTGIYWVLCNRELYYNLDHIYWSFYDIIECIIYVYYIILQVLIVQYVY